jgi:hypothetical protein
MMSDIELSGMPGFAQAMQRVDAWFHGAILDRAPVRFSKHNAQYESVQGPQERQWPSLKDRWMDAEYQVETFLRDIDHQTIRAESFPVFWPNLGPDIYAAFFGCALEFGDITSWSHPLIDDLTDDSQLGRTVFDPDNPYLNKLREMTRLALEMCRGKALVGITSWCPGIDCLAAWCGPQNLCLDILLEPERVKLLGAAAMAPFRRLAAEFQADIQAAGLPMVSWMGIPFDGSCHIAQTDFANMISPKQFEEFCLPLLRQEIAEMERVIFHMDGKGVANHLDYLLEEPGITAIQWVQGVGTDEPILQWIPLIKRIQAAGKSLVVDLKPHELEPFMAQTSPEGIFLCIAADENEQDAIVQRLLAWK